MDSNTETWTETPKKWTGHTESNRKKQSLRLQDVVSSRIGREFLACVDRYSIKMMRNLPPWGHSSFMVVYVSSRE